MTVAKSCQDGQKMLKFGKIAKRYQKWPPEATAPKSCKRMQKFAQNCQNLQNVPKVAKPCQKLTKVAKR